METVRQLAAQLGEIDPENIRMGVGHLVVPVNSAFRVQGELIRTRPTGRQARSPGEETRIWQDFGWIDMGDTARSFELAIDLAAIVNVASGRSIHYVPEQSVNMEKSDWRALIPIRAGTDSELIGPIDPGSVAPRFRRLINAIIRYSEDESNALGAGIRLRAMATALLERDPTAAYLLIVAGIEAITQGFWPKPTRWGDWSEAEDWDMFISKLTILDDAAQGLREKLLAKARMSRQGFRAFVVSQLDEAFWTQNVRRFIPEYEADAAGMRRKPGGRWDSSTTMEQLVPRESGKLRQLLNRAYDARSEIAHIGRTVGFTSTYAFPWKLSEQLSFEALRRILDYIIWKLAEAAGDSEWQPPGLSYPN